MERPFFSREMDADPRVQAWLASLDERTRNRLRDDVTPLFKEVPLDAVHVERLSSGDEEHAPERLSDEVLDHLRATSQNELFPEMGEDLRGAIMLEAREHLPDWQFRAFALWFSGANRNRIARVLGVSRSTVRSALDGEGRRGGPGAIAAFMAAVQQDADFQRMVMSVATKSINKQQQSPGVALVARGWFKGIEAKPGMVEPLALLAVLDGIATGPNREVRLSDVFPHFPRSRVQACLTVLKALGYVASDGHVARVCKTPTEGATP